MAQKYQNIYTKEIVSVPYVETVKTLPEAYLLLRFCAYVLSNEEIWEANLFKKYWTPLKERK